METFTQKWAIISLLEDAEEGPEFYYTDFPLHVTLAGVFAIDKSGRQYNSPEYQGGGYLPHSTFQKSGALTQGEKRKLRSVSLVDLLPNGDGHRRKLFKTIELL